ncbi:MAG: transporter, partial [Dehalococcoidia bacterium]|nr:transporter [Dehalococcoidia bacterium]
MTGEPQLTQFFARTFVSLKYRDFRFLLLSSLGLGLAQWFQNIGLNYLVLLTTGKARQIGFISALRGVTGLIAAPIAGVLADRFSRRLIVVIVTLGSATQATVLAGLVLTGQVQVWHYYVFVILEALFNGMNQPARQAFVYDVSSRETAANAYSLQSMVQSFGRVMGPNLAGAVIGFFGVAYCFFILAVVKGVSAIFTMMISPSAGRPRARIREPFFRTFAAGIRYAYSNHAILALLLINTVRPLLLLPYLQYLPVFARDVFCAGRENWASCYGLLASAAGIGAIPGALLVASLGDFRGKGTAMIVALLGWHLMVLIFSRQTNIWFGFACLLLVGICLSFASTLNTTLLQLWSREDMRGRVNALQSMEQGFQPLGQVPMGFLIDRYGAPNTVTAYTTVGLVVASIIAIFAPKLREEPPVQAEVLAPVEEEKPGATVEREAVAEPEPEPSLLRNGVPATRNGLLWLGPSVLVAAGVYIATRYIRNRNNGTNHSTTPSNNRRAQGRGGKGAAEAS